MSASISRRKFLITLSSLLSLSAIIPSLVVRAFGMGKVPRFEGIHSIVGEVYVNGQKAKVGDLIKRGDVITTGKNSSAIFVSGTSAFLVRDNSRIEFPEMTADNTIISDHVIRTIHIVYGKLLSVFGSGNRKVITTTAVIGVRGTGIYIETEEEQTYLCTCYGVVDIEAKRAPGVIKTVKTRHHEAPFYINGGTEGSPFIKAKVINHTDKELIMLEALVGRQPPFYNPFNTEEENVY